LRVGIHLSNRHIAIHVIRQGQLSQCPVVFEAELVDCWYDPVGLHFDVRPHGVVVEHEYPVLLDLWAGGIDIAFGAFVGVLGVNINPIEIGIGKGLESLHRVGAMEMQSSCERKFLSRRARANS
jgi:hypothetical protein